jgi:nucleoside-diphosphate-sugar epimerase
LAGLIGGPASIFGLKTSLTRHNAAMMGRNNDLDTSKARRELGWKTRIPYDEAKQRIRKWMKQAGLVA